MGLRHDTGPHCLQRQAAKRGSNREERGAVNRERSREQRGRGAVAVALPVSGGGVTGRAVNLPPQNCRRALQINKLTTARENHINQFQKNAKQS